MKKLVVTDIDGTLLNTKKEISPYDREIIIKAMENGVALTIASGRIYQAIHYLVKDLDIDIPVSSLNGSIIVNSKTREHIKSHKMDGIAAMKVMDIIYSNGLEAYYYTSDGLYSTNLEYGGDYYMELNKILPDEDKINLVKVDDIFDFSRDNMFKIVTKDNNRKNFDKVEEALSQISEVSYCSSWYNNIEIFSSQASKGRSVEEIADFLGIDMKNVMVIGDHTNDLSMFQTDAFKVAMGNAEDSLKEKADFITSNNDNGGIGKAIKEFMKR